MNILAAQEIKRRGVKAIELALRDGPVHIIKNNSSACVVLTKEEYTRLTACSRRKKTESHDLIQWLAENKSPGSVTRKALDARLHAERDTWD